MKAALLTDKNNIACREVEEPQPKKNEVKIKVAYCGICGSDVPRVLKGQVHSFPIVLGHEFSGVVQSVGEEVDKNLIGKKVAGIPLIPCFKCQDCKGGDFSLCKDYSFVGSRKNGAFAEFVCLPKENVMLLDDDADLLTSAFFEPATVAVHGIEIAKPKSGKSALILGCGTIGCLLGQCLFHYGIDNIVCAVHKPAQISVAESVGLNKVVATQNDDWEDQAIKFNGGEGFDYIFDVATTNETVNSAFRLASNHAKICLIGTPKNDLSFTIKDWELINRKELHIFGSWMSYSDPWPGIEWQIVRKLFSDGTVRVSKKMIDSICPLSKIDEAFSRFEKGEVSGKVIIKI